MADQPSAPQRAEPETPAPETSWAIALIQGGAAVPRAVAKLINTVGEQIGLLLEPFHLRRRGKAEAAVSVAKAKAEAEIAVIQAENRQVIEQIEDRADERVRRRETRRQRNVEAITAQAAKELEAEKPEAVSEQPVDEDWVAQFFNHSQDVSNEQMQGLWARLLAGEVKNPGSFSLRTLSIVRVLKKEDADLFTRFCTFLWEIGGSLVPLNPNLRAVADGGTPPQTTMDFQEYTHLDSLGLIRYEIITGFNVTRSEVGPLSLAYYGRLHTFDIPGAVKPPTLMTGNTWLTDVGQELARIAGGTPDEGYRARIVTEYRSVGWKVTEG